MSERIDNFLKNVKPFFLDFSSVIKGHSIRIFATLGALVTSLPILEKTSFKKYIDDKTYLESIGLTQQELVLIVLMILVLYFIDRYLSVICYSKLDINISGKQSKQKKAPEPAQFKYNPKARNIAKITRLISWLLLSSFITYITIDFCKNNDYCDSKFGNMAIKICQFSDSYQKENKQDEITMYVYNKISQTIRQDSVEVSTVSEQIEDPGPKNPLLEKYLSCFYKGMLVYGYKSAGENTFFCNIYLKNMRNLYNRVKVSNRTIVLDDPKFIFLKESFKGKYISKFILGLYYYYNKQYDKSLAQFSDLTSDTLSNQVRGFSNLYLGYNKLLLNDTSGFANIKLAKKLTPDNLDSKDVDNEEHQIMNSTERHIKADTFSTIQKKNIAKIIDWPLAVVSVDKLNILYVSVKNTVSILANGENPENIKVKLDSGTVSGKNGRYILEEKKKGVGIDTLRVLTKNGNEKWTTLYKKAFRIRIVNDPQPQFGGISTGSSIIENLKIQDRLFAISDNLQESINYTVVRFTLIIVTPRRDPAVFSAVGNQLNAEMQRTIRETKSGSTLVFKDIIATNPNGVKVAITPLVITVN